MIDIVDRLSFDATRCEATFSKGVAANIEDGIAEIKRLRAAFRGATDYLECIDMAHPDLVLSIYSLFPIKEMVERYRAVLDNQQLEQKK